MKHEIKEVKKFGSRGAHITIPLKHIGQKVIVFYTEDEDGRKKPI